MAGGRHEKGVFASGQARFTQQERETSHHGDQAALAGSAGLTHRKSPWYRNRAHTQASSNSSLAKKAGKDGSDGSRKSQLSDQ